MHKLPSRWSGFFLLLIFGLVRPLWAEQATPATVHRAAVESARKGDFGSALRELADLVRRYPKERLYLHDYISVLQRAGKNREALALRDSVDSGTAPAYVLESLSQAARSVGERVQSRALLLQVLKRYPGRAESLDLLAQSFADPGESVRASGPIRELAGRDRVDLYRRMAPVMETSARYFDALYCYQEILRAMPDDVSTQTAMVRVTERLGAVHLASTLAQLYPKAVDAQGRDRLARHSVAREARWGRVKRALPKGAVEGNRQIDAAIARSDALAKRFLETDQPLSSAELSWLHDRMVILRTRHRSGDVIALFDRFEQRRQTVPTYALLAAADAYLSVRQPLKALRLYERVLLEEPDSFGASVGKLFALSESEQHRQAYVWVDALVATKAAQAKANASSAARSEYWDAQVLQAMAREYAGESSKAMARLARLRPQAPANAGLLSGLAGVYRSRGWPRQASDLLRMQTMRDSDDVDAWAESVVPLLDSFRFAQAHAALREATWRDPAGISVTRATRAWEMHARPEFALRANSGRSSNADAPSGRNDHSFDAFLYSPPLGERYRVFAHGLYAQADLSGSDAHLRRAGAGVEYRGPDLRLATELHAGIRDDGPPGLAVDGRWWISDQWIASANVERLSSAIPLQARFANIDVDRLRAEMEWRQHEARSLSAAVEFMKFSDGNRRGNYQLAWRETWWTRPALAFGTRVDLDKSNNTQSDAPYFNPDSDRFASLTLLGEWRSFRWYQRSFTQQLALTGGRYWQDNFPAHPIWGVEYAHVWDLDDALYLRYGVSRTLRAYDGQQTGRNALFLDLNWRF